MPRQQQPLDRETGLEAPGLTAEVAEEVGTAEKTAVGTELVEGKFGLLEVAERTAD